MEVSNQVLKNINFKTLQFIAFSCLDTRTKEPGLYGPGSFNLIVSKND